MPVTLSPRFPRALPPLVCCAFLQCGLPTPSGVPAPSPASQAAQAPTTLVVLPEDGAGGILAAIAGAHTRVWGEMYMLTSFDAMDALAAARGNGADVRLLLEPAPYGDATANQTAFDSLTAAGVDARWFAVPDGLVHAKFLVIDAAAWILTLNLTLSGLTRNREYAVVDRGAADVGRLADVWQGDAIGAAPGVASPATRVVVAPLDARARVTAALDAAHTSVAIEVEELSDADFVTRLIGARDRGVELSIVVPARDRSAATNAAVARLSDAGVAVRALVTPTLHAKAMVVDHRTTYLGSINFTRASFDDNREVGVIETDPATASRVGAVLAGDWTRGVAP